jgi:hypothetical protein
MGTRAVVGLLLDHVGDALADTGDTDTVNDLPAAVLQRGNGAAFQRSAYRRSGSLTEVVSSAAAATTAIREELQTAGEPQRLLGGAGVASPVGGGTRLGGMEDDGPMLSIGELARRAGLRSQMTTRRSRGHLHRIPTPANRKTAKVESTWT